MSTKSRQSIYGGRVMGAKIRARHAREAATKALCEADRAEAEAWSIRMEGYGGPAQPSPTIAQCLNGGYGWLEVKCHRCETTASIPPRCDQATGQFQLLHYLMAMAMRLRRINSE